MAESSLSPDAVGKIVQAQGSAFAVSDSGTRPLTAGSEIFKGDTLVTEAGGILEVLFRDNTALSQGEESQIRVDSYVYDAEDPSGSDLLLNMTRGVFRTVTGEIAEKNPDHFKLSSPLATIGIRGTTVVSEVRGGVEKHGVEEIGSGHVLVVQDAMGNIQFMDAPRLVVEFHEGRPILAARPLTQEELDYFRSAAPITAVDDANGGDDENGGESQGEDGTGEDPGDPGDSGEEGGDSGEEGGNDLQGEGMTVLALIDFSDLAAPTLYSIESVNAPDDLVPDDPWSDSGLPEPDPDSPEANPLNVIIGTGASEFLTGTDGDDSINGGGGHDTLSGGAGNDILDGGNAQGEYPNDEAWYHDDPGGVSVNLYYTKASGYSGSIATDGWGDTDILANIGGIIGSKYADAISITAEYLVTKDDIHWYAAGMEGNDTISGSLDPGDEGIAAIYVKDPGPVTVNLGTGTATDGWGDTDTLVNVRVVAGSDYNDTLYGSNNADGDTFVLTLGNDSIVGLGSDKDEVDFVFLDSKPDFGWGYVDLVSGTASGYNSGGASLFTDTLSGIEDIGGSQGGDTLLGDTTDNMIDGYEGNDFISGGSGGVDSLIGGKGSDVFRLVDGGNPDFIADFTIHHTDGNDRIQFSQTDLSPSYQVDGGTLMGSGNSGASLNGTTYQIINVLDQANADFSNKASVIDGVINVTGSVERTYVLLSNGTDTRVYHWAGDVSTVNGAVDDAELTQLAELHGFADLAGLDATNLEVV